MESKSVQKTRKPHVTISYRSVLRTAEAEGMFCKDCTSTGRLGIPKSKRRPIHEKALKSTHGALESVAVKFVVWNNLTVFTTAEVKRNASLRLAFMSLRVSHAGTFKEVELPDASRIPCEEMGNAFQHFLHDHCRIDKSWAPDNRPGWQIAPDQLEINIQIWDAIHLHSNESYTAAYCPD